MSETFTRKQLQAAVAKRLEDFEFAGQVLLDRQREHIAALEREAEELRAALESSITAIDDWLNIWAEELCDPARVAEAKVRTNESGTLWYIAKTQEANRKALSTRPRKPTEAEGRTE